MKYSQEQFIENWKKALEAMGTNQDFYKQTSIHLIHGTNADEHPLRVMVAPNFTKRGSLMDEERKQRKVDCFLCEAVHAAMTSGETLVLSKETYSEHIVIPNRYPSTLGHSLLVAKAHNGVCETLTRDYLAGIVDLAHASDLLVVRNHPRAGMSIPEHEHVHAMPRLVRTNEGIRPLYALGESTLEPFFGILSIPTETRFATLACSGANEEMIAKTYSLLSNLERNDVIFTFYYDPMGNGGKQGTYFITPHKQADKKVSGSYPLYNCQTSSLEGVSYEQHLKGLEAFLYTKNEFPWKDYLK